ncbi:MAG TPA: deoxyribose-phosphate aldolase [Candidatus Ornithoclostridium faecigallinarum]|nr:deoxyribose-phosphate aldolase [Candidatus Ornithoclostridium faecigallinarum]
MQLEQYIDFTNLKPDATRADIEELCKIAKERGYANVCVNGAYVALCRQLLRGSGVGVACVVGFPLGASATEVKAFEAAKAVEDGADEIDMVMAVGALKGGDFDYVAKDIAAVKHACGVTLKVIIEECLLTDEQIAEATKICVRSGADIVKTSTGFSKAGATLHAVEIIKANCGDLGIKAAGGIRDAETARAFIEAGATRIGASAKL